MIWAIIPAAGFGARTGLAEPKQYQHILGKPMLHYALDVLSKHPDIDGLMLAVSEHDRHWDDISRWRGKPLKICIGGATRRDSVLAALVALPVFGADDYVLVHDAARPCLRYEDLDALIQVASNHPVGALLAAKINDTVKTADTQAQIIGSLDRSSLWRAFTPQMFPASSLQAALQHAEQEQAVITDEASAMERLGLSPLLLQGAEDNIKVTLAADFTFAEAILLARNLA